MLRPNRKNRLPEAQTHLSGEMHGHMCIPPGTQLSPCCCAVEVGPEVGAMVGVRVEGAFDGEEVGKADGAEEGKGEGAAVGASDGVEVGKADGEGEGKVEGAAEGVFDDVEVGAGSAGGDGGEATVEHATRLIVFPDCMRGTLQVLLSSHQPLLVPSILSAQDIANLHSDIFSHNCMHASQVQLLQPGFPTRTSPP